jgi:hypothetical protein
LKALSAWLYRTTRLAAKQALRNECRRREREEKFAQMDHTSSESVWQQIEPHLGEVMDQLGERDRTALVLRFFESKSLQDVARALGTGEDAARMRVNRAIEKLRRLFAKRGVVVPAGVLLATIAAGSVEAAPVGLATIVATAAFSQKSAITTTALVKGTLKLMTLTKFKTAAVTTAALLLLAGTTAVLVHQSYGARVARAPALSAEQKAVLAAAESLVSALARGDGDAFAAGLYAPDESERRLAASYGAVAKGIGAFDAALRARFGDTDEVRRIRYTFSLMSGIPLLGYQNHPTKIEVVGDEAYFRCPFLWPSHKEMPLQFVRSNGEWKLRIDIGRPRFGWLEQTVVRYERVARQHEEFARQILEGRYKSANEAWEAWSGQAELPTPAGASR